MANKKAQLMAQFYSQCQEKGYSDMSDATQSLKAKVIATDLDLKYKDIASFYEEAKQCYVQVKQEEEEKARKQQEDEARKSVSGALLAEISNIDDVDASGATVFRVFIRPDKSIYTTINGREDKIEGAPAFNIQEGQNVLLTYHPSKAVYTSATVGGITTGGVHYTKEGYSARTSKTGKADIFAAIAGKQIMVEVVRLSEYAINAFRRDSEFQALGRSGIIHCHMYVDPTWAKFQLETAMKMENYESKVYALNKAADEQRYSCEWCEKIVDLVARIVNGQFPPTDEELYAKAEKLAQGTTSAKIKLAADAFDKISDYKDASERAKALRDKYEEVLQTEKETAVLEAEATKKRNKKLAKIIISVIVALAVVGLLVTKVVVPSGKYKDAVALMEAGQYTEAIAAFEALNGFKRSKAKIEECNTAILDGKYSEAVALMEAGKYEKAITAFKALKGHKDSATKIDECNTAILDGKYSVAIALMNAGQYTEARDAFMTLNGYKDSAAQLDECNNAITYSNAEQKMKGKQYTEAIAAFKALNGYKDSAAMIEKCCIAIYGSAEAWNEAKNINNNIKVGDTYILGSYEQDNNTANGKEEIEWIVLSREDTKILVISKYALDCRHYSDLDSKWGNVEDVEDKPWEKSDLRAWLNGAFMNLAFTGTEQSLIRSTHNYAHENPDWVVDVGNDTTDRVFLLSAFEARNYFATNSARVCQPTAYAVAKDRSSNTDHTVCKWWLRTAGCMESYVSRVLGTGEIDTYGMAYYVIGVYVRPAMWIDLYY